MAAGRSTASSAGAGRPRRPSRANSIRPEPRLQAATALPSDPIARSTPRTHSPSLPEIATGFETDPSRLAPHRIKRCTYRRLISLDRARERIYEVECLYPDRKVPIPLGDLDSALPICNACAAAHIFRPDED